MHVTVFIQESVCQACLPVLCLPRLTADVYVVPAGLAVRCSHNSRSGSAWGGDSGSGAQADTTLAAQRYWLRRQRVLQAEPHPSDADIIELNVGGTLMVTSRSTLRQASDISPLGLPPDVCGGQQPACTPVCIPLPWHLLLLYPHSEKTPSAQKQASNRYISCP